MHADVTVCLCQRRGGTLLYSWLYVGAREWVELCYIHVTLCLCQRKDGMLAIFMELLTIALSYEYCPISTPTLALCHPLYHILYKVSL